MTLKQRILAHIDSQDAEGGFSDAAFEHLARLVDAIRRESPVPDPGRRPERLEGRWETAFAHFGAKHSAGKTRVHDSNLKVQSFNRFPPVPIRVRRICQEIACAGSAYNNVIDFDSGDGLAHGQIVVRGVFRADAVDAQRFAVDFQRVEISPREGSSEAALRGALGFGASARLAEPLKPPRLHSDVVYLDDDMRINLGSLGGLYLLRRSATPPVSVQLYV
jgi:hypothetical protein